MAFEVADSSEHYHVPILLSAYGFSTYRGSWLKQANNSGSITRSNVMSLGYAVIMCTFLVEYITRPNN